MVQSIINGENFVNGDYLGIAMLSAAYEENNITFSAKFKKENGMC